MRTDKFDIIVPPDLKDLPPALLYELTRTRPKRITKQQLVLDVIQCAPRPLTKDAILVSLWRKHAVLMKRNSLSAQLSALKQRGRIEQTDTDKFQIVRLS